MDKIREICVVGLGYVGLPAAIAFYESNFDVLGIDISPEKINKIKMRENPLEDESSNLAIPEMSKSWRLTSDFADLESPSGAIIVCVPTPVDEDKNPDISIIEEAMYKIFDTIVEGSGVTIVVESTVYPGVTRRVTSQAASKKGLTVGRDFHIAYCPERVNPGDSEHDVKSVARVIGCDDPEIGQRIVEMYSAITDAECRYVGSLEVAEAAKMVENVQRDIDIAFTNELARILPEMGLDVEEVLEAASTKWNFHRHRPGIGVGGHCIPVDPYYYIEVAKSFGEEPSMAIAARSTNSSMPIFSGDTIMNIASKNDVDSPTILILGYSYKPDVGDNRETPVAPMRERLIQLGANVVVWDPYFSDYDLSEIPGSMRSITEVNNFDAVVIGTAHSEILNLDWGDLLKNCTNGILFDGRRFLDCAELEDEGWKYFAIGRPY